MKPVNSQLPIPSSQTTPVNRKLARHTAWATVGFAGVLRAIADAHGTHGLAAAAARHWTLDPVALVTLTFWSFVYGVGLRRLWAAAGRGHGIATWQAAAFAAGLLSLVLALFSPVAWLSEVLFSVHMTQHEILMLVAAPLLVMGQPLLVAFWALPKPWRERSVPLLRRPGFVRLWRTMTGLFAVFVLHALALWIWHAPVLFEAAVGNYWIHVLQHVSFLLTAALFWWGTMHGRYGRAGYGLAVLYVFLTAVHSSVLGALMTISPDLWYPTYLQSAAHWHMDALEDQQLAGLLMWVPSSVIFIVLGLALFAAWLGEAERRATLGTCEAIAAEARKHAPRNVPIALLLIGFSLAFASACGSRAYQEAAVLTGGDPSRGMDAIGRYGCGACHDIPGIRNAKGSIGPPLTHIANRAYLAGQLPNTPDNMTRWIQHPQHVERGTAMPEMGVTDTDARNIVAYLYTLR
jgi:putative membrane protein